MNVYLIENQLTSMVTRGSYILGSNYSGTGSVNFFLQDAKQDSSQGKGIIEENRFPWKVQQLKNDTESSGFNIRLECTVSKESSPPNGIFHVKVQGDIVEILKYVYSTETLPEVLVLKFKALLKFPGSDHNVPITHEMRSSPLDCKFKANSQISYGYAAKMMTAKKIHLEALTMQLIGEEVDASPAKVNVTTPCKGCSSNSNLELQNLNERIWKEKICSDFVLVTNTGIEFLSHKAFLAAQSPVFERMFLTSRVETEINRYQTQLSEKGLETFLGFVYCSKFNTQNIKINIAAELLQFSHDKEMPLLERMVKDFLMVKAESWFEFDATLNLFLYCNKKDGYEDLKKKLLEAIRLKRDDMATSEVFKMFLKTDTESAIELIWHLCVNQ